MATLSTTELEWLSVAWKACFRSAKVSGIVGDKAHANRGGYHISREDNPKGNYSVVRPDDLLGPADRASAVDMNLSPADMKTCSVRLVSAYANKSDPRRKYINAFNGTIDGKAARRWDLYARNIGVASPDHMWHVHLSVRRRYATSLTAMKAILSVIKGETVSAYMTTIGVTPVVSLSAKTSVTIPKFPGVLKRSDSATANANVKLVQTQLMRRGWKTLGPADGVFGPKLEAAVKQWQASLKLTPDGVIGPATWPTFWSRPLGS